MCKHLKDPRVDQSGCYSTECDESGASISMIEVFPNRKSGTSRMDDALKDKEEPLLSEIDDTLGRSTASQPGQQINKGKYYCIMDKLSGKNESQKTFGSSQNLREFYPLIASWKLLSETTTDTYGLRVHFKSLKLNL